LSLQVSGINRNVSSNGPARPINLRLVPTNRFANKSEENQMPLIQVRVIKDVFSKDQKRQIINKLTDAMVSVEGENMRGVTWVTIEEVESGDWGIGGNALTTSDVHALARGKAA
jgi:4-oxalocrotonate tautomerase